MMENRHVSTTLLLISLLPQRGSAKRLWFSPIFSDQIPILLGLCGAHVVIIPGLILALTILHFLLVKRHKTSPQSLFCVGESGD